VNENLYERIKRDILGAIVMTDDRTPVNQVRHLAHDATYAAMLAMAEAVRDLDEVTLESVLYQLGQRP
jgi:hypothetical protein